MAVGGDFKIKVVDLDDPTSSPITYLNRASGVSWVGTENYLDTSKLLDGQYAVRVSNEGMIAHQNGLDYHFNKDGSPAYKVKAPFPMQADTIFKIPIRNVPEYDWPEPIYKKIESELPDWRDKKYRRIRCEKQ